MELYKLGLQHDQASESEIANPTIYKSIIIAESHTHFLHDVISYATGFALKASPCLKVGTVENYRLHPQD